MTMPTMTAAPDQAQREFEDELMELDRAAPQSLGQIGTLLARFNAGLTNPAGQTVGDFAETIQSIQAELKMMARHFGMPIEPLATDVDWAEILAAADAMADETNEISRFTVEQLAALSPAQNV